MAVIEKPSAGGVAGLTISIIGLGLMGGSFAKALKRGTGARVLACGRNAMFLESVRASGVIDLGFTSPAEAVADADLTVVCLYPDDTVKFIRDNMPHFKPGSVVTDIAGVKRRIVDGLLPHMREDVEFVPGHPMAGRERAGYQYSVETLFDRCNYILTPHERNTVSGLELMKRFAGALGAVSIVRAEPDEHDEMIAYTSQLPHALAVAYVLVAAERDPLPFSAGSYRDVSRVAAINARMWAELFVENADALAAEMQKLSAGMARIATLIRAGDRDALAEMLSEAAALKEERL